jgi:hypothetical protein
MCRSTRDRVHVRCLVVCVTLGLAMFINSSAAAQGQGAVIIGQVTDESGAVLPGATVTATSPALQVPSVTAVTNELGEYRLAPLPIGTYVVLVELSGFRPTRREEIRLTVGFTARIDVALGLASVAESITVSGAAPVVDVSSTASTTLLTKEELELLPTARNGLISLMNLAPGVRTFLEVGADQMTENPGGRVFGLSAEPWYMLEGVATAQIGGSGSGNFYDYQTIEEAKVQTLGTDAESPTRGVQINAVVKSGGNQYHGSLFANGSSENFQSSNIDEELESLGIDSTNSLVRKYDYGGDLGGRLVRDKLWFYGAARRQGNELQAFGTGLKPDGSPARPYLDQDFLTAKISFQANRANRFVGFFQQLDKVEVNEVNEYTSWEARGNPHNTATFSKIEWEGMKGNSLVASFLVGYREYVSIDPFLSGGIIGRSDIETQLITGESPSAGDTRDEDRMQFKGAVTWYKPNWGGGNHEIKAGGDWIPETTSRFQNPKPAGTVNYHLIYDDGEPFQMAVFSAPTIPKGNLNYLGLFVKDRWVVARRVTLNIGIRYDQSNAFIPATCREAAQAPGHVLFAAACYDKVQLPIWKAVAPRIHAAYDLTDDGKTVIKGGWGRYNHIRLEPDMRRVMRNAIGVGLYRWTDADGNNDYTPGEVNLDPNAGAGGDFLTVRGGPDTPFEAGTFSDSPPTAVANLDQELPTSDEYSLSFEREVVANLSVRATGVYSRYNDIYRLQNNFRPYGTYNIPITNPDPGGDGTVGTSDDPGVNLTYWEYSTALEGVQFEELMSVTDEKAGPQTYSSIELAMIKRLANRWQFMAAYSATRKNIPVGAGGPFAGNANPNADIFALNKTWDWQGKVSGSYNLPYDVLASANFEHRSGDAFARTVQLRGGTTIPSIVVNAEQIGTRRLPNINILSFRAEKSFALFNTQRIAFRVDLFNALNANTATGQQARSGPNFLRPTGVLPPRVLEFGTTYTF